VFLHLIQSDRKFLNQIRSMFEAAAPGRHRYVVVGALAEGQVLPAGVAHLRDPVGFPDVFSSESDWEGVVIHGLPFQIAGPIVDRIPETLAIAWYVWGFEAYEFWPRLSKHLLMPETRRVANRLAGPPWKRWVLRRSWLVRRHEERRERRIRNVASRYDYCVAQYREEYDLFVATGLLTATRYHCGSVGSFEDVVDTSSGPGIGDDIQLGNSASVTNNHVDAFRLLCSPTLLSQRVVVPLGYGDERYRLEVASAGRRQLGDRFVPLMDFMPLDEYLSVMSSCGHVVMNHLRQQALGNIYAALWRGASVYMNDTAAFRGLRRAGFSVRLIEEEFQNGSDRKLRPESEERVASNRDRLHELLGRDAVVGHAVQLLDRLTSRRQVLARLDSGVS